MLKKFMRLFRRVFWSSEKYARYLGVEIGDNCSIATLHFGSEPYLISIGNHVQITSDVRFFTHGGGWNFRLKHPEFDTFGKIKIGNNVYIGNCTLIMPGIIIGDNVIIGAGSVVTKSFENDVIIAGNPAKVIGSVFDLEERLLPFNVNTKWMNPKEKKKFLQTLAEDKFLKR